MPILKTNKGDINLNDFGGWQDITLGQYIRMRTEWDGRVDSPKSMLTFLSIITGMTFAEVENDKSKGVFDLARYLARFLHKDIEWHSLPVLSSVLWRDREIPIPQDLDAETFGQKASISSLMQHPDNIVEFEKDGKTFADYPNCYGWIIAIYLQPFIDAEKTDKGYKKAPFKVERAEEIKDELLERKAIDMVPLALFFCRKFLKSLSVGPWLWVRLMIQSMSGWLRRQISGALKVGGSAFGWRKLRHPTA